MTSYLKISEFLDMRFPGRWVGRDGPIPWPSRSPDTMPLDFFLWRYDKNIVYKTPVISLYQLKLRIVAAIGTVTPQTLENTWREIDTAWTSYMPRKARMLNLFSIFQ
jgi:hypothetical protein